MNTYTVVVIIGNLIVYKMMKELSVEALKKRGRKKLSKRE